VRRLRAYLAIGAIAAALCLPFVAAEPSSAASQNLVVHVDENDFNATTVVTAALGLLGGALGVGGGVAIANKQQRDQSKEKRRLDQANSIDSLIDACQEVVGDLPKFGTGDATSEDQDRLQRDLQRVVRERDKLEPSALRAEVSCFGRLAQGVLAGSRLGDAVSVPTIQEITKAYERISELARARQDELRR
jgi:hypothetical protein